LTTWDDADMDGLLDQGDRIKLTYLGPKPIPKPPEKWWAIPPPAEMWTTVFMVESPEPGCTVYLKCDWYSQKVLPAEKREWANMTLVELPGNAAWIGTKWHIEDGPKYPYTPVWANPCTLHTLTAWRDTDCDGEIGYSDQINMTSVATGNVLELHVFKVETRLEDGETVIKIKTADEVAFGIELHNDWVNPIPLTKGGPARGELIVEKVVKLSVEDVVVGESGTGFPPGQWLHFQEPTKVHLSNPTIIRFKTAGTIKVNDVPRTVTINEELTFPPSTKIEFPTCMEIILPEPTQLEWLHTIGGVQILPTEIVTLKYCEPDKEQIQLHFAKCRYNIRVEIHIIGPPTVEVGGCGVIPNPWLSRRLEYEFDFWATLPFDIGGKWYVPQVPCPDCKVNIRDISAAAGAFGTYPGHPRWWSVADVNGDYKVNIKDIGAIAGFFGWAC